MADQTSSTPPRTPAHSSRTRYGGGSRRPDGTYAAPQRYSIALMMVVTTAFAALLTAVRAWFDMRPAGIVAIFFFFVVVGVGQSVLFQGKKPRGASLLCGAIALPLVMLFLFNSIGPGRGGRIADLELACLLISAIFMGAPAGYLAGGLIGGVFLICDQVAALLFPGRAGQWERDATFDEIIADDADPVLAEVAE